jgi:hypothetical protein
VSNVKWRAERAPAVPATSLVDSCANTVVGSSSAAALR